MTHSRNRDFAAIPDTENRIIGNGEKRGLQGNLKIEYEMMGNNPANLYTFAGFCIFMVNKYSIWK